MAPDSGVSSQVQLTVLLRRMQDGDRVAAEQVADQVYSELRLLARLMLANEPRNHSLQPTSLVNEAFVRLLSGQKIDWQNRQHFFVLCARMMRRLTVDHFRGRNAKKRPYSDRQIAVEDVILLTDDRSDEILAVDEALHRLEEFDLRAAQVVELKYFGGRSVKEIAGLLDVNERTVRRDWLAAQMWLKQQLSVVRTVPT